MPSDCFVADHRLQQIFQLMLDHPALVLLLNLIVASLASPFVLAGLRLGRITGLTLLADVSPWVIGAYVGLALGYLVSPNYVDHVEPSITAIAQQVVQGHQVYLGPDDAQRYSLLYGPALYIANAAFVYLAGEQNPIFASKLSGVVFSLGALAFCYLTFRRHFGRQVAKLLAAFIALCALWFQNFTYSNRADALIFLAVSASLAALTLERPWLRSIALGLALGVTFNTKLHAWLYFLPLLALLWRRDGWRAVVSAGSLAAALAALPFLVWPQIFSASGYLRLLDSGAELPLSAEALVTNFEYALLMLLPWGLALVVAPGQAGAQSPRPTVSRTAAAGLAGMLAVSLIGSTVGAGPYHLFPFALLVAFGLGGALAPLPTAAAGGSAVPKRRASASLTLLAAGWLGAAAVLAPAANCMVVARVFSARQQDRAAQADLLAIQRQHAGMSIQMGYGSNRGYRLTWLRPWLYQDTAYILDATALMDMEAAEEPIPPATFEVFTTQQFDIWLVPRGDVPFSMPNWNTPERRLFSPELAAAFTRNYVLVRSTPFFELWQARRLSSR